MFYQQVYCVENEGWEYIWKFDESELPYCPQNALHSVRSTQTVAIVQNYLNIKASVNPSPFVVRSHNIILNADTSDGDVTIVLPQVPVGNETAYIIIAKQHAENSVIIGDGGISPIILQKQYLSVTFIARNGMWTEETDHDSIISPLVQVHDIALNTSLGGSVIREWSFQYRLGNARNNTAAVMGSWHTLPLNTVLIDSGSDVSLSGNTITIQPGKYRLAAMQSFYKTERTAIRLRSATETVAVSPVLYSPSQARIDATFTVLEAQPFTLQYRIDARGKDAGSEDELANGSRTIKNGLGKASGFGEDEIYTDIFLTKIF